MWFRACFYGPGTRVSINYFCILQKMDQLQRLNSSIFVRTAGLAELVDHSKTEGSKDV